MYDTRQSRVSYMKTEFRRRRSRSRTPAISQAINGFDSVVVAPRSQPPSANINPHIHQRCTDASPRRMVWYAGVAARATQLHIGDRRLQRQPPDADSKPKEQSMHPVQIQLVQSSFARVE